MCLSTETSISEYSLLSTPTLTVRFHLRLQCLLNCAMMHAGSTWAWQSPREEGSGMSRGGEIKIVPVCLFATPTSQRPPTGHCQKHLSSVQAGNCWWIVLQNRISWHLKYLPSDNAASGVSSQKLLGTVEQFDCRPPTLLYIAAGRDSWIGDPV